MQNHHFFSSLFFCLFFLAACSTPTPTQEVIPTEAVRTEETETITLYLPAVQNKPEVIDLPEGIPLTEWRTPSGLLVPIMPGAVNGEEIDSAYTFTVGTDIYEIQVFYEDRLTRLGWESQSLTESPNVTVLGFRQGDTFLTVSIQFLPEMNLCIVQVSA